MNKKDESIDFSEREREEMINLSLYLIDITDKYVNDNFKSDDYNTRCNQISAATVAFVFSYVQQMLVNKSLTIKSRVEVAKKIVESHLNDIFSEIMSDINKSDAN